MADLETQATPAIEKLMQSDTEQLFTELGLRQSAIANDSTVAGHFDPALSYNAPFAGPLDTLKEFGQAFFDRMSRSVYDLTCGDGQENKEDRKKLEQAFGLGTTVFATTLATMLVSSFGLAPAIAAVVAALSVKLFFRASYGALCDTWKKHLPA